MTKRARRVNPELSAKRAAAGRRGAAARWGHPRMASDGNHQPIPVPPHDGNRGRRLPPEGHADWVRIENKASGGTAEIYIYDEIGYWGTTAQDFVDQLNEFDDVDTIELHINSPGGDVFPALAIYNALIEHDAKVLVKVDGLAASAASFIAQAGDVVVMAAGSTMMIHDAFGVCVGTADDMAQMAATLDRLSSNIAGIYSTRTGEGTLADWRESMKAETWYTAAEAVSAGLANEVASKAGRKRSGTMDDDEPTDRWDLSVFKHGGRAEAPAPTIRPAARHAPAAGDTIPVSGPGTGDPATAGDTGPAGDTPAADGTLDPFADITDDAFTGIAAALDDAFGDAFELDPDVLRASVADAYQNAPAPPTIPPAASPPLTSIDIDDFVNSIQEAMQP